MGPRSKGQTSLTADCAVTGSILTCFFLLLFLFLLFSMIIRRIVTVTTTSQSRGVITVTTIEIAAGNTEGGETGTSLLKVRLLVVRVASLYRYHMTKL